MPFPRHVGLLTKLVPAVDVFKDPTSNAGEPISELKCDSSVSCIFQLVVAKVWHTVQLCQDDP